MDWTEARNALFDACTQIPPDLVKAKELIEHFRHTTEFKEEFDRLPVKVVSGYTTNGRCCDECENDMPCEECNQYRMDHLPGVIRFFIDAGWNTQKSGMGALWQLALLGSCHEIVDTARLICNAGITGTKGQYEALLKGIGTEESYQRCCEEDHAAENILYAYYEGILRVGEGRTFDVDTYRVGIGRQIDRVVLFGGKDKLFKDEMGRTCFGADIGFICGEKILIVAEGINIYVLNCIEEDAKLIECDDLFGIPVLGRKIVDVGFTHRSVQTDSRDYGQPTIILTLDNGTALRFTHNYGELPDNAYVSRIEVDAQVL